MHSMREGGEEEGLHRGDREVRMGERGAALEGMEEQREGVMSVETRRQ